MIYDARTRDQFLQRLGRAGRVLGKCQTDLPSYACGLVAVDEGGWRALQALDGQTMSRRALSEVVNHCLQQRGDLYSYMPSYAMIEVFRPLFNLKQTLRPDLHTWLKQLFDGVKGVFAPDNRRWTFASIDAVVRTANQVEQAARIGDDDSLAKLLDDFVAWNKWQTSSEEYAKLRRGIGQSQRIRQPLQDWVAAQQALNHSLFSFREALPTPSACVYDPRHLLAETDVTTYDALHVAANYEVEWFEDSKMFESVTRQLAEPVPPSEKLLYGQLLDHRSPRLRFVFEYDVTNVSCTRERFESIYCRRPVALKGLRLRGELIGLAGGSFPIVPQLRGVFEDMHVPMLLVPPGTIENAVLRSRLRDTNIFAHPLTVVFTNGTQMSYTSVIGSAAFSAYAELESFFWIQERKMDQKAIIT